MKVDVNQEKARKMGRALRNVMSVFYWLSAISPIILGIALVVITILPESKFVLSAGESTKVAFSLDGLINFKVNSGNNNQLMFKAIYQAICFMSIIISTMLAIIFKQLAEILKSIEDNKPFDRANSQRLSTIACTLMAGSFIFPATEVLVANNMIKTLFIENVQVNYRANTIMIIIGFLVFILAGVFKYGSYLQREHDTTI